MGTTTPVSRLLRTVFLVDAAVFLFAALLNLGLRIPLGFGTVRYEDPIWQAATGEIIIGAALLAAGLTGRLRLSWVAWVLSVLGIVTGLSSARVQGLARDIHVVMVPLAVLVLVLLVMVVRAGRRAVSDGAVSGGGVR